MNRCESAVGVIRCSTDVATINAIASASGLRARQGTRPHFFRLFNSGRRVEPEVGADLFEVVRDELDRAVSKGLIPPWSVVVQDSGKS